ncbi:MAG: plastocyanin/azurin family copper-binding protein [Candidatus Micrarchaeota archaeon]
MRLLVLGLILVSLMLTGCAGEEPAQNVTNVTPPPPPAPTPVVSILSPYEGEVLYIAGDVGDVTLGVNIQNLLLKSPGGQAASGQGHFRLTVDGGEPQTVATKNFVISGLALGQHTLELVLLNNDGTPYSPSIKRQVAFTVERETPAEYVPQEHTVNIKDFSYDPAELTVKVSDKVTFLNIGAYPRSATCFIDGKQVFDTGVLGPGQSKALTMDRVMECEYYATTHRAMTGMMIVESNGN